MRQRDLYDNPVLSARIADSSMIFADIAQLYLCNGQTVVDVNYGRGWFWGKVCAGFYNLIAVDVSIDRLIGVKRAVCADQCHLPIRDDSVDAVVIDPPYGCLSTVARTDSIGDSYNLNPVVNNGVSLYRESMIEANRVLRSRGVCVIKCQDAVNSGKQHFTHIGVYALALGLGWVGEDLFVAIQQRQPRMRHKYQLHSRKNMSYYWVFRKRG